jgi:hypothetical protein
LYSANESPLTRCQKCNHDVSISAKFCSACGNSLEQNIQSSTSLSHPQTYIAQLGEKFEEAVESIFIAKGFTTTRRKRLVGESGTINEIDVLAEKGNQLIAIECKNYSSDIGIEHLRNFWVKLVELKIHKGYFVTNSDFSSGACQFAQQKNITLWNREDLMEMLYSVSVGRVHSTTHVTQIHDALPIAIDFQSAANLDFYNKEHVTLYEAELVYHPYFAGAYSFNAIYHDPTRKKHAFRDKGTVFIDALDGRLLNDTNNTVGVLRKIISRTTSDSKTKLLNELKHYHDLSNYPQPTQKFSISVIQPEITYRNAKKTTIDFIINQNIKKVKYRPKTAETIFDTQAVTFTPKRKHINLDQLVLFYVPKWRIEYSSNNLLYTRQIFAYSGTVIEDTIAFCPEHTSLGKIHLRQQKNNAVCEVCGRALCETHVKPCPVCGKWACYNHAVNCEGCENLFCAEHIPKQCEICGQSGCESCLVICESCNKTVSKVHTKTCDRCHRLACSACITSKGLIRKKNYCANCQ